MAEEMLAAAVWAGDVVGGVRAVYTGASVETQMESMDGSDFCGTALCAAAWGGHIDVCKLLLVAGADIAAAHGPRKRQALAWAGEMGHAEIATVLLDSGAAIEAADDKGDTALTTAAQHGHATLAGMLLDRGAAIEAADDKGATALIAAAHHGHAALVEMLLDRGAAIETTNINGDTALIVAATKGHTGTVEMLLDMGATIEATDICRRNALVFAARNGHTATVQLLLERCAAIEAASNSGNTALIWAAHNGHIDTVEALLDRCADRTHTNIHGLTAYDYALRFTTTFGPALLERLEPPSAASFASTSADAAEAANAHSILALSSAMLHDGRDLVVAQFTVDRRADAREYPAAGGNRFIGCNSAVFEAHFNTNLVIESRLALVVIYTTIQVDTNDLLQVFETDYAITEDPRRSHPNIVRALGHFVETASQATLGPSWDADPECIRPQALFLAMEWTEGSLARMIGTRVANREGGAVRWPPVLSTSEVLVILQRLLRAVVHLREIRVVHRDINPDNVLVQGGEESYGGTGLLVKLANFGEALDTLAEEIDDFRMPFFTRDTPRGGAPTYLAPEVMAAVPGSMRHPQFIDYSKNDVFAAGMVAHYMLTNGRVDPFSTNHPGYSAETYTRPPQECPESVADLVWTMVNPSLEHRVSAIEALAAVDALIGGPRLAWT
jgi:ankyrin repeat protein